MIDELHAKNVALIKDAAIAFDDGLTVITGETGSGKTALLGSLKLLVGERANASLIREGADELSVEGRFFVDDGDEDGHVAVRRVDGRGRGRVSIDGSLSSVKALAATLGDTVDLCGQHEHQRLLSVASHVALLDGFAGDRGAVALDEYRAALKEANAAAKELARLQELSATARERLDQARFTYDRIMAVDPQPGELEALEEELPRYENAEALRQAAEGARQALSHDGGAIDALAEAGQYLLQAPVDDPELASVAETLASLAIEAEDAASSLRAYRDAVDVDPERLAVLQARQAALQGLARTMGPGMERVLERKAEAEEVIEAAEGSGDAEREAEAAMAEAEERLSVAAGAVSALRRETAPGLAEAVTAQMARLEMGGARLTVEVRDLPRAQWTASQGPTSVELLYQPGAGMVARPLRKIASGGEVSRVMLATKVVQGNADDVETLVFDEVDAGVGGSVAVALGEVLRDLSKTHQVICVTHLAQVAVFADRQYVVSKRPGDDGIPETQIHEVTGDERVEEVARMLSGDTSDASLNHAREMLEAQGH
ncbi:DNA repair protein RecN [Olsenella sp. YH-ols2217]|uniref:DNA repair protein RecN n=1 Tax=Kribbibacterium absianum TaxID=3044210 RepID=A0ABT6ZM29_9ACTN|nr:MULTISPECIES: DNA repair protein RecN [unclassified Olsenella]MDJ1122105.1 DNA repair protein RecN [Olsenella sp. YH-ols2216]MDJ1130113.1 DNA repair protein RecN [Olsenella sp. YH-ols2217]